MKLFESLIKGFPNVNQVYTFSIIFFIDLGVSKLSFSLLLLFFGEKPLLEEEKDIIGYPNFGGVEKMLPTWFDKFIGDF
jgi:hypothetical protein